MYLRDLLDIEQYNEMVREGYISVRKHPEFELYISNYTPLTQYSQRWNRATMLSRGLITNDVDRVIARPWAKFFNLGERDLNMQFDDRVEVMDKADGSLGILYPAPDGTYGISTRGSFASEQALHATALWKNKYAAYYDAVLHDGQNNAHEFTFLFEIVYRANRIVLDYGDMDDLILLGAVNIEHGYYLGPLQAKAVLGWNGPVVETFPISSIEGAMSNMGRSNAEGYVVRSGSTLVKIKEPDYLDLHRLKFNMNPKRIWELLSEGEDPVALVSSMPDEFQSEVETQAEIILEQFNAIEFEIENEWIKIQRKKPATRREFAELALKTRHPSPLFTLADGGTIESYIWKQVRPKVEA